MGRGKLPPPKLPPRSKEWARKAVIEVQENQRRLDGCPGPHDFQPIDPVKILGTRYRCSKCNGDVDHHGYHWYVKGLQHGLGVRVDEKG